MNFPRQKAATHFVLDLYKGVYNMSKINFKGDLR